jgi:alanine dehydrogenase
MTDTLILSRNDVAGLLSIHECMDAVEAAFRMLAEGKTGAPKVLALHAPNGGLHIKAGIMNLNSNYIVAKMNSNFPDNPSKGNLPTIQGAVAVFNADNGALLALMDSIEITIIRTGAATGVAAKYLSKKNAKVLTICGCGNQGLISANAIVAHRDLEQVYLYDNDRKQAEKLFTRLSSVLPDIEVVCVNDLRTATKKSDIVVTCTPSKTPIIDLDDVAPGTFIAAVGTDNEDKNEIHPRLTAACKIIVDLTEQAAAFGDLHHAIKQGYVSREHVHSELGEIIAGQKTGRENDNEMILFDSTGTAIQDVAAASIVYERAVAKHLGQKFNFQQ